MADRFWILGTGNINDTAHWSTSSGGSGGASVPGAGDVANFDSASAAAAYNVTVNVAFAPDAIIYNGVAFKTSQFILSANITLSGNFTFNGNSRINQVLICSNAIGTKRTITCNGTVAVTNTDFKDITGAGSGSWDFSLQTDIGGGTTLTGCSGITFPASVPQYWYKASGAANNWSTAANWYLGTGGSGGAGRVPLIQDFYILDNLSFGATGMTLTQDMPRIPDGTWLGVDGVLPVTNVPTFTTSTAASVFGGMALHTATTGMVLTGSTQTYTFEGRGSYTLTSAGNIWAKGIWENAPGGTLTLQDSFFTSNAANSFALIRGTFDANGNNFTAPWFDCNNSNIYTINLGNGLWTLTSSGNNWSGKVNANATINAADSTIKFTDSTALSKSFTSGGKTFNNFWFAPAAGSADLNIIGGPTFADFKDDGTAAHAVKFTKSTTTNVATFNVNGAGGGGSVRIILDTVDGAGTFTLHCTGAGPISCDWLDIRRSTVDASPLWYAGVNSLNTASNTNWIFTAPPSGDGNLSFLYSQAAVAAETMPGSGNLTHDHSKALIGAETLIGSGGLTLSQILAAIGAETMLSGGSISFDHSKAVLAAETMRASGNLNHTFANQAVGDMYPYAVARYLYKVLTENRIGVVAAENRIGRVPAENRITIIPDDR
jgi:hypothetical protein